MKQLSIDGRRFRWIDQYVEALQSITKKAKTENQSDLSELI
jgi:hypothetical protein